MQQVKYMKNNFYFVCGKDKTVTLISQLSQCPWTGGSLDKLESWSSFIL